MVEEVYCPSGGIANMGRRSTLFESAHAERMFSEFFNRSNIGLAILDEKLCYRMCNPYLAASNGTCIESHLGKHVREILGNVSGQVEPAVQRVFATAQPVLNWEVAGVLPTRPHYGRWTSTFFPIADSDGRVKQVGALVIEWGRDTRLQSDLSAANTVLRSWKDIAHYVGASVKTVQRWEHAYEFPVRRVKPSKGSVVFAFEKEVQEWLQRRNLPPGVFESRVGEHPKRH